MNNRPPLHNDRLRHYQFGRFTIFLVIAACVYMFYQKPEMLNLSEESTEYRDQLTVKMDKLALQYFIDTSVSGECTLVIMQDGEPQALTEYDENSDLACKRLLPYIKEPSSQATDTIDIPAEG